MLVERDLIMAARRHYGENMIGAYNSYALGFEADLIMTSRSGYATEFEAKISLSDFRADAKKTRKHLQLQTGRTQPLYGSSAEQPIKHYWYVVPDSLVAKVQPELPEYAGLLSVSEKTIEHRNPFSDRVFTETVIRTCVERTAPALSCRKVTDREIRALLLSMYYKAWRNATIAWEASRKEQQGGPS